MDIMLFRLIKGSSSLTLRALVELTMLGATGSCRGSGRGSFLE